MAGLAWINIVAVAVAYMLYQGYIDHGESAISAMAWKLMEGAQVYYPMDSPERISNVYGPVTFLWHAWPLALFGGTVSASKIAAMVAAVLMTPALFILTRGTGSMLGWIVAFLTAIYTVNVAFPVVIRPDALLTLVVAVAVFAAAKADTWGWRSTVIMAMAAGIAVDIKIHGFIYLAPIGLYHLSGNWRRLPVMAIVAAAVAGLFFVMPAFPLTNYLAWFGPMAGKENNWLVGWFWEIALYYFPFLFVALGASRRLPVRETVYLGAYGLCVLLTVFPATKLGGGSHYFMPFLPMAADLLRRVAALGQTRRQRIAITAMALLTLMGSFQAERRFFKRLEWGRSADVTADIADILDRHKDKRVQMTSGYVAATDATAPLSFHYYQWRNLPVYRGNPYTLDVGIMMELTKLGVPFPAEAVRRLASCHTQVWLVPKDGEPLNIKGYYNQQVFPQEARDAFFAHTRKVESSRYFDLWECLPTQ
ncbi:hypothetical protein CU669_03695 [Paramagnetospirillum kuznetsovii]|uniref:Glycosyltransferase RgtA/B/C/D-like domain-containing protein n=1 Tax=Paramagnetospirillum kuznetsovii TaxID=2053833 RepID=A0A364P1R1_9PROT|nr:hypothetical protein CU669_03695 [Paramagnetospirillum kuznetsovii]